MWSNGSGALPMRLLCSGMPSPSTRVEDKLSLELASTIRLQFNSGPSLAARFQTTLPLAGLWD